MEGTWRLQAAEHDTGLGGQGESRIQRTEGGQWLQARKEGDQAEWMNKIQFNPFHMESYAC